MTTPTYVLDAHALIWHLQDSASLSPKARSILDDVDTGKATAIVPSIVLVEMVQRLPWTSPSLAPTARSQP